MTKRVTFTRSEINAVARAAERGIRLAMIARLDGSKVIVPANEADLPPSDDFDARLAAFGRG